MAGDEQGDARPGWLGRRRAERARAAVARRLYAAVVARARRPAPYARLGVPDTADGRFEMLGLETALVLRRLRAIGPAGEALGQSLLEVMVTDLDRNLREMGVGDLSVGRWVKRLTASVLARAAALDPALAGEDEAALAGLLGRWLYPDGPLPSEAQLAGLVAEVRATAGRLAGLSPATLLDGRLEPAEGGKDVDPSAPQP